MPPTPSSTTSKFSVLPTHVAIVPDGNGRWAEKRGLTRLEGHQVGAENMYRMVQYLNEYPIPFITLYGFSTENWTRPEDEVYGLFEYLAGFMERTAPEVNKQGIKIRHIGRMEGLPEDFRRSIQDAIELTRNNTKLTLNIAFNYGGRAEIVDALKHITSEGIPSEDITEELLENYLYTAGSPNVDLLIRTGDERRLSNFLLWQTIYSEYHFTRVLWPDFGKKASVA